MTETIKNINNLIKAYDKYIKLIIEELHEVSPLAVSHGWKSTRYKAGEIARKNIEKCKQNINKKEKKNE